MKRRSSDVLCSQCGSYYHARTFEFCLVCETRDPPMLRAEDRAVIERMGQESGASWASREIHK